MHPAACSVWLFCNPYVLNAEIALSSSQVSTAPKTSLTCWVMAMAQSSVSPGDPERDARTHSRPKAGVKHWARIIQRWPVDKVRPGHVSFQTIMRQRLDKATSTPSPSAAATSVKANDALVSPEAPVKWDEAKELQQASVLYALLDDRFSKKYPLPAKLRQPTSRPTYYDDLVKEMQDAPHRSWFGRLVTRLRGSLRFS